MGRFNKKSVTSMAAGILLAASATSVVYAATRGPVAVANTHRSSISALEAENSAATGEQNTSNDNATLNGTDVANATADELNNNSTEIESDGEDSASSDGSQSEDRHKHENEHGKRDHESDDQDELDKHGHLNQLLRRLISETNDKIDAAHSRLERSLERAKDDPAAITAALTEYQDQVQQALAQMQSQWDQIESSYQSTPYNPNNTISNGTNSTVSNGTANATSNNAAGAMGNVTSDSTSIG